VTTQPPPPAEPPRDTGSVREHYMATGPWAVSTRTASVPGTPGATLVHPTKLGAKGYDHPIVTWANGMFRACTDAIDTLRHLASWGYFVVCPNTRLIVPDQVFSAARWAVGQGRDTSSIFHQELDTTHVAAVGHSRGAGMSLAAGGRDPDLRPGRRPGSSRCGRWSRS
jgi:hypothetical protein